MQHLNYAFINIYRLQFPNPKHLLVTYVCVNICDYVNDVVTRTLTLVLKINLNTFSKIYSQPSKIDVCIFAFS